MYKACDFEELLFEIGVWDRTVKSRDALIELVESLLYCSAQGFGRGQRLPKDVAQAVLQDVESVLRPGISQSLPKLVL